MNQILRSIDGFEDPVNESVIDVDITQEKDWEDIEEENLVPEKDQFKVEEFKDPFGSESDEED